MSTEQTLLQYLTSLKEGDVVYRESGANSVDRVRVSRTTRTQIILVTGGRYNRTTGASIGSTSGWERSVIMQPTPQIKAKWQRLYLAKWASKTLPGIFQSLTPDQQAGLYRQIKDMEAKNKGVDDGQPAPGTDNESPIPCED
ncbi:hypothetical protein N0609_11590 [Pseudomonas aeruginosa]|uniref:hypothetical protein n=1 Tax=Pseudomonas aeruginosa TaxID=287 RepID=UPI003CFCBE74|nr:hypothetical protein [Pseudomonas aeruginosa]MCS8510366.1 hypothetical protein [Pseudomonas aeruginosa]MCS8541126.1 hypothetical protein [Pseudomonas aeruginosa]MCT0600272.1 hypothetical protein [Pseudomonas aeruginosa]